MNGFVLDASCILAYVQNETGKEVVAAALHSGIISSVNLAEVISKLREKGILEDSVSQIVGNLLSLGCKVASFGHDHAVVCGNLRTETKVFGLSLGDRACLALAHLMGLPVLTADKEWQKLDSKKFSVVLIR